VVGFEDDRGVKPGTLLKRRPVRLLVGTLLVLLGLLGVISRATSLGATDLARNEFTQDYVSARAARQGLDPYAETFPLVQRYLGSEARSYEKPLFAARNPHPPSQIVLVEPVSRLGYRTARLAWLAAMALFFAVAIALVAKEAGLRPAASGVAGIAALAIPVIQKDLLYGQVNAVLLLAMVAGWLALKRRKPGLGGVLFGLAAAVKLFPVFLVIPLFRRNKRAVVWQLSSAAALTLGSAAVLGWASLRHFIVDASPSNFRFWRAAPVSISLVGFPFRWLSSNHWNTGATVLVPLAWALAACIVLGCVVGAARTRARLSRDLVWAATPWMILATPLAWESYLALTVPFCVLVVVESRRRGALPPPVMMVSIAILLIGVPPGLPSSSQGIGLAAQLLGYALPTWALVVAGVSDLGLRRLSAERYDLDAAEDADRALTQRM
jgi:glycosyl transferase family 87